jgi:predicted dehydrogenase
MMSGPVRLGLIGVGRWGRNYVRTITGIEGTTLAWVASRNPDTAALLPIETCIGADWRELLSTQFVDGVIVATPPATHADIVIGVLDTGRAVLVEKPLVARREELVAVERAAADSPAAIMVDHTHLFHPAFRALKRECAMRGGPIALRGSAGNFGPYRHDVSVLWDWAPHDIAMALDLRPGPVGVIDVEVVERRIVEGIIAERVRLALNLAGDVRCDVTVSTLDARHRWFAVDIADGTLIYTDQGPAPLRWVRWRGACADDLGDPIPVPPDRPLAVAVSEFVGAIREGRRPRASLALGCQVVEILACCQEKLRQ